jgi:hypothetical protein
MITPYSNIISVTTLEALLLDTYSGAAAAYSLRKLSTTYTGSAIRVRRASDNTEQDIGFVDNELDTSALTTFCSGTDGFVETWYDQSGNARDATQSTAADQPQIVSSGSVILENGKPSLEFNGTSNKLSTTSTPFSQTESTLITVAKQNGITSGYKRLLCIGNYNDANVMKLPYRFEQFKSDPSKAITYLLIIVVTVLYVRSESQSKTANARCEKRLERCEMELKKMSSMLKSQDSLCSALVTEIKIYKTLGKI